ncbi:MAG: ribonuclease BN [Bacteroidetes bacterium GWA2_30_7]|nr:MAG: ribonuclease BN [Bacteroidetes bacterium GWA2_30_7]
MKKNKLSLLINSLKKFFDDGIWHVNENNLNRPNRFFLKQLKTILIALKGFNEDKCIIRASALTYFTLLSIVPVAALIFGIAKGFGIQQKIEEILMEKFASHQEVLDYVLQFANKMLDNTQGGLVAGIGIVMLLWSVMKLLNNVEASFNDIWEIKAARSFVRKFSDYFSLMFFAPILMILSSSMTVFITTQIANLIETFSTLGFLSPVIFFFFKMIPYVVIWLVLTLVYMVMPNTKVNFKSALVAGIIAGTLFQFTQWGYIKFQIGVSSYNGVYGSFAALPLFLIWIQLSWLIVLFGAEISFANQNVHKYEYEAEILQISNNFRRKISILISHFVISNFAKGNKAYTADEISKILSIPIRVVRQIIFDLVESGIFSEVRTSDEKVFAYQPALDINLVTINKVIELTDNKGKEDFQLPENVDFKKIELVLSQFNNLLEKSAQNILVKDLNINNIN